MIAAGINGKMNEFNAALGVLQLQYIDEALVKRQQIDSYYRDLLKPVRGIKCGLDASQNYAYFPVIVEKDYPLTRDALYQKFRDNGVYARRYFYPLISSFPMYRSLLSAQPENLPVAAALAQKVICLPIYPGLSREEIEFIVSLITTS